MLLTLIFFILVKL